MSDGAGSSHGGSSEPLRQQRESGGDILRGIQRSRDVLRPPGTPTSACVGLLLLADMSSFCAQAILSLYASGRTTGVVLDCGEDTYMSSMRSLI